MVLLEFEPGTIVWWAQMNLLSYFGKNYFEHLLTVNFIEEAGNDPF